MTKKKTPIQAYKHLLQHDADWDYGYLLALEKKKLQRMNAYFSTSDITDKDPIVVRDTAICIKLIDIIVEKDVHYNSWLERSFHTDKHSTVDKIIEDINSVSRKPVVDFPAYINVRNEERFFRATPIRDAIAAGDRNLQIYHQISLRKMKAMHLYNLIREYRMFDWWD